MSTKCLRKGRPNDLWSGDAEYPAADSSDETSRLCRSNLPFEDNKDTRI